LDGPFPKWFPAVTLSHQDGHQSAVALLLKVVMGIGNIFKIDDRYINIDR
jgi:hypothetical protein